MGKVSWKPGTMVYPVPAVMVSCGTEEEGFNIITVSWTGTICTDPAMCYISVRPERHSYDIIKRNGEFVINLTTRKLAYAADWCGVRSGAVYDKFREMKLTPEPATKVKAPLIAESPLNIECRVRDVVDLGSHHMFVSEVLAVNVDEGLINPETGVYRLDKANLICYSHGKYYDLGKYLGHFGFSVKKDRKGREMRSERSDNNK